MTLTCLWMLFKGFQARICYSSPCSDSSFHFFLCNWNVRPVWLISRWCILLSHLFFSQSSWSCWTSLPCCRCWKESSWSCRTVPSHCWGVRQLHVAFPLLFLSGGKICGYLVRWWSESTHTTVMSRSSVPGSSDDACRSVCLFRKQKACVLWRVSDSTNLCSPQYSDWH